MTDYQTELWVTLAIFLGTSAEHIGHWITDKRSAVGTVVRYVVATDCQHDDGIQSRSMRRLKYSPAEHAHFSCAVGDVQEDFDNARNLVLPIFLRTC